MSQPVRDLDFGIGSEASRRIADVIGVVHFNLEHDGLLQLKERGTAASPLAHSHIACQHQQFLSKQITESQLGTRDACPDALNVNIRNSAGSGQSCRSAGR
jgi:hypothetical protein